MAKRPQTIVVECPCCEATLKVDVETGAVLSHKEKVRPRQIEDLNAAVAHLKEEAVRRDERFQKSFADEKNRQEVLSKKFDELFKQAKEDPDMKPRPKEIDLD